MNSINVKLNGKVEKVAVIDDATLLWTLREKIGLKKVLSLVTGPACVEPAPFMWMGNQSAHA
jgi:aerobic-type carbon monoxide dehydrogenase small subunit (CoxS/CutS family)